MVDTRTVIVDVDAQVYESGLKTRYGNKTVLTGTLAGVMNWLNWLNAKPFKVKSFFYDTVTSKYVAIII